MKRGPFRESGLSFSREQPLLPYRAGYVGNGIILVVYNQVLLSKGEHDYSTQ